jgi:hypothetical protein
MFILDPDLYPSPMDMGLGSGIRDPENTIPDPGSRVKKAPDPGSGSATQPTVENFFLLKLN